MLEERHEGDPRLRIRRQIQPAALLPLDTPRAERPGALAAGHRARLYDAVVLKTLGATRLRLLGAYLVEYGLLGLATAVFGVVAGTLAAWYVVVGVMKLDFSLALGPSVLSALAAVAVAVGLGLAGTWRILGQKPAPYLRTL